jgi:acyl-CoA thioester hydrolase
MDEYPITIEFPIHWGEMDALGHVNNARFFTWFESARIALAHRIGLMATREQGPILATTTCDFLEPIRYPADVVVGVRVAKVGNTSLSTEYGVWSNGRLYARGSAVIVFVRYATGEKLRIPDAMRAAIDALGSRA